MFASPWDPTNSDEALRRDIERWERDATACDAAGFASIAKMIRTQWIGTVEQLIGRGLHAYHA